MGKKSRSKAQRKKVEQDNGVTPSESQEVEPLESLKSKRLVWQGILVCLLAYGVGLGFRLLELPAWDVSSFIFNGEYLMATHDAYVWLAGAEGINRKTGSALSQFIGFMHELSGGNLANVGFWLPAIFAPLAALPVALLGWRVRQPEAGLASGIMTAGCLGFLLRTRLGFVDTDIWSLFFPIAIAAGLMIWLSALCRRHWFVREGEQSDSHLNLFIFLLGAVGIGLLMQVFAFCYKVQVGFGLIGFAFLVGLILTSWNRYHTLILGFCVLAAVAFGGWIGLGLGLAACGMAIYRPQTWEKWLPVGIFAALMLVPAGGDLFNNFMGAIDKVIGYSKIFSAQVSQGSSLELPTIAQSVREAQNVNWDAMASRTAGNWWLFWAALAGYAYLVWKRPLFLIFLPLLGLAIASVKLGNRFAMFGGAALGVGLAFGINQLLLDLKQRDLVRWGVQIVLCALVVWPLWGVAQNLSPAPILPRVYAQTFVGLKQKTPQDAQLWQWWDYGYAGQYFAKRRTFGDGGKHGGKYLYPLARVHATNSALQANQMMKLVAKQQMQVRQEMIENGTKRSPQAKAPFYPGNPVGALGDMGPKKAQGFVESLKTKNRDWSEDLPKQYFVLSWENLRLAYWISYYGNWDLVTGESNPGQIQRVKGDVQFDLQKGKMKMQNRNIPLSSLDVINKKGARSFSWSSGRGVHALLNKLSKEMYLLDDKMYNSMMVQMLIKDPENFEDNFKLVVDHFPWNRAYLAK